MCGIEDLCFMIVFLQGEELAEIIGDFERVHKFEGA